MPGVSTAIRGLPLHPGRRHRGKTLAQQLRVVLDRANLVEMKQLGKHLHHGFTVFQHVGHARWRPCIVLKNVELSFAGTDDVGADNVRVDPARGTHADHFRQESVVLLDQRPRHAARLDDFLLVVDIVQKGVERHHALFNALRQLSPFRSGNDPRHDVEGNEPFRRIFLAVYGKGNTGLSKDGFGVAGLLYQIGSLLLRMPVEVSLIGCSRKAVRSQHFIERHVFGAPLLRS
jgi:hypothetical protein